MKFKKWIAAAMACTMLAGCGGNKAGDGVDYSQTYDPKIYNDFILSGNDFESLNYLTTMLGVDIGFVQNLIDGLVEIDCYGVVQPSLAEKWDHNEDYSVWTFKLREGVKWYEKDGTDYKEYAELTADDFVYAVEYILDPENASLNVEQTLLIDGAYDYFTAKQAGEDADFSKVGVKALDKYTVEYTMQSGGKPYFLSAVQYISYRPANRQYITSIPDQDGIAGTTRYGSSPDLFLYCGPYLMGDYVRDNSKTLLKNENYWDAERVTFDKVNILAIKDTETALEMFERGELNRATLSTTQVIAQQGHGNQYLIQQPVGQSIVGVWFNSTGNYEGSDDTNKAIANENFRKAMFYGLDADQFNEVATPGDVKVVRGYGFTAQNWLYTEDYEDYTTLGDLGQWQEYHYNPDLAKEYMDKAVEELKAEGVTFPLNWKMSYPAGNETEANRNAVFQDLYNSEFEGIFNFILDEYATSWWSEYNASGDYSAYLGGWGYDYQDPINGMNVFKSEGTVNARVSHWVIPEFDAMVEAADAITTDVTERYTAFANAEAYLLEHALFVPIYTRGASFGLTTVNMYSKDYTGGDSIRYVGWEAMDHAISAEEMDGYKATWETERAEALANAGK